LAGLGALEPGQRITTHGKRMATLGLAPRLAHMVLRAAEQGDGPLACALAALLSERDGGARDADLRSRLELLAATNAPDPMRRVREIARRTARQAGIAWGPVAPAGAGAVLALAYPDRIAQRRTQTGRFLMSGGQGAFLPDNDPLAAAPMLVVADLDGQMPESRIWLAAPLTPAELELVHADRLIEAEEIWYEPATRSVQARRRRRFGALVLGEGPLDRPAPERVAAALLEGITREGLGVLPWTPAAIGLRRRIGFLSRLDGSSGGWPALDDASLIAEVADWLGPALIGKRGLGDLAGLDLAALFLAKLDHRQRHDLESRAPTHLVVPSGSRIAIDYAGDTPILAVKLQEMFGLAATPTVADGRVQLVLHLLSPAQRPIQVTSDLPGFWTGSYKAVRADLRGRYPRHPWPEDPLAAVPTARAKSRGT
jgi:ATP-dependent helicase HrpB